MDKLGVFLCSGCGIGDALDLGAVDKAARERGCKTTLTNPCLCAEEGLQAIRDAVASGSLNGILICACSERAKAQAFDGLKSNEIGLYRVSLREQVIWTHPAGHEDTQALAEDLVRMGLARLEKTKPFKLLEDSIADTVLVVGGGRAGLEAARTASALGHPVIVVEKGDRIGGRLAAQVSILPERPPYDQPQPNPMPGLIAAVEADANVTILTAASIAKITGQPGQFEVCVATASAEQTFRAGAIVQATGARPYDARKLAHLGYGASPDVVTSHELEAMLAAGKVERPSDHSTPNRIVFIQCAGSRDPQHLPYCSSECCSQTLRQVAEVRRIAPAVESAVVYKDMRTPGLLEHFYLGVQASSGVMMTRGEVAKVEANGKLSVHLSSSLLGDQAAIDTDLVVLAVGMVPNSADGVAIRALHDARTRAQTSESEAQRKESAELAEKLADHEGTEILNLEYRQGPDLPTLRYGFPDSHFICFPYETRRTGIYAAGTLRAPMDAVEAAEDGCGAALKAVQCVAAARRGEAVHPRAGERTVPDFALQRCTQCKRCTEECPFGTLNEDQKGTPQFYSLRCRRCGICLGSCPERIVSFPDYSVDMVATMIKAMKVPEDFEEKPRIVAMLCENDAYPALDAAAARRVQLNPWVRVIPVRCLGSFNIVWVAEALSRGIDGVILIGCKYGDDYQCHYMHGSELANTRLGNVGETLQRLALEPERVKVVELSHEEFHRISTVLDEYAAELEEMGPNPLKGF